MHRRINNDEGSEQPPIFNHASQNVAAAAMLVRAMLEPSTMEGRRVRGELRDLLETAAVQQAYNEQSNRTTREDALDQLEEARDIALLHSAKYQQAL